MSQEVSQGTKPCAARAIMQGRKESVGRGQGRRREWHELPRASLSFSREKKLSQTLPFLYTGAYRSGLGHVTISDNTRQRRQEWSRVRVFVVSNMVAASHMKPFRVNLKLEIQLFCHTSHISSAYWPHEVSGLHYGQHRYRSFPSLQRVLLDSPGIRVHAWGSSLPWAHCLLVPKKNQGSIHKEEVEAAVVLVTNNKEEHKKGPA